MPRGHYKRKSKGESPYTDLHPAPVQSGQYRVLVTNPDETVLATLIGERFETEEAAEAWIAKRKVNYFVIKEEG